MGESAITWDSKTKRKLTPWRGSPNKSKSAKRVKLTGPEAFRAKHDHAAVANASSHTTQHWSEKASMTKRRGAVLEGDAPLDAAYEAMFIQLHYDYKDAFWRGLAKDLIAAHEAPFVLEVLGQMRPTHAEIYAKQKDSDYVPRWFIQEKVLLMLGAIRRQLAGTKQDEYDAARAKAEEVWEASEGDLAMRLQLAYLFPDHTEWGDAVALAWPARYSEEASTIQNYVSMSSIVYGTGASKERLIELNAKLFAPDPGNSSGYFYMRMDGPQWNTMFDLVDRHGEDAVPVMVDLYNQEWPSHPTPLAEAMALIESAEIAQTFANKLWTWSSGYYRSSKDFVVDIAFLHDHPELSVSALETAAREATTNKDRVEGVLADIRAQLDHADLEEEHSELFIGREELPRGLSNPPWRDASIKQKKRKKYDPSAFADLAQLPLEVDYDLGEGGGSTYDATADAARGDETEKALLASILKEIEDGYYWYWSVSQSLKKFTRAGLLELLEKVPMVKLAEMSPRDFESHIIRPLGSDALPALKSYLEHTHESYRVLTLMDRVGTPDLASHTGFGLGRVALRARSRAWVTAFPEAAAVGAIPSLLKAEDSKVRNGLIEVLCIAYAQDPETAQKVIDAYGEEVAAALPTLDVYLQCPSRMPKLPHFWTPELWTPIRLKSDPSKLLPREIYEDIGFMLKFSPPGTPYIGLVELGEVADETSLAEFAWDLFESWVKADSPNKESWIIQAIALFGGARMADRLPHYIDRWYDSPHNKRAEKIMYALESDENPYVIETFWRLIQGGFNWALFRARAHIEKITGIPGGIEAIADEKAPTFGMDQTRKLEFIPGSDLEVWLDADLEPHLRTSDKAEAELDPTNQLRWERLQALCARQNRFQAVRFERAMKTQRRWAFTEWHDSVFSHPLLGLLGQRIIWGTYDGDNALVATWRVDESNEIIDAQDEAFAPPVNSRVGIAHPIEMAPEDIKAWTEVLSDFEIIQPFEQITKPVSEATGEAIEALFAELDQKETTLGAIQEMCYANDWHDQRNRKRDYPVNRLERDLQDRKGETKFSVFIAFRPGFSSGRADVQEMSATASLSYGGVAKKRKNHDWGVVDPVELAELHHELSVLMTQVTKTS